MKGVGRIYQQTFVDTYANKIYTTMEELQIDLEAWIDSYNHECTHQGKVCFGRTPMATFEDGKQIYVSATPGVTCDFLQRKPS